MKKLILAVAIGIIVFFSALVIRSLLQESKQEDFPPVEPLVIASSAVQHLSTAISIPTISHNSQIDFDSTAFRSYIRFLSTTYPAVDSQLQKTYINDFSIIHKWQGRDSSLKPILLMSHYDVVPVEPATRHSWKNDPYSGAIVGDTIWGRGGIDDKTAGIAILETFERLLRENFQPDRTIYFALGHDEEKGGFRGAQAMSEYLRNQGVAFEFVLDEGGAITQDIIPGVRKQVALISIAEKGFLNLELSTSLSGGHSSIPLGTNAIDVLSAGLSRLRSNPFPSKISKPVELFFDYLGPESSFGIRFAFANSDVLRPLMIFGLEQSPQGKANIRTTIVPTIFSSGIKENVIPKMAYATVNLRILPGETVSSAIDYVRRVIDDDRIDIKAQAGASEPSKISDIHSPAYRAIYRSIREIYPKVVVVPNLLVGGTDSRYYADLTEHTFRFRPLRIDPSNIQSFHGLNERVLVADLEDGIRFFYRLIKNSEELL